MAKGNNMENPHIIGWIKNTFRLKKPNVIRITFLYERIFKVEMIKNEEKTRDIKIILKYLSEEIKSISTK